MRKITYLGMFVAAWMSQLLVPALALNDTIGVTAGLGKTANLISFGSTNVISEVGICDATTENRCATVNASGQVLVTGPVTNAGTFAVQAAQSGTWTMQPGNTANTTAWLVTGTGGTFPVTQAASSVVSGAYLSGAFASGAISSGADVTEGTTAETTVYAGSGGCTVVACLKGVYAAATAAATISQVTPGTTNGISIVGVNGATALAGTGAVGTGAQRVAVGTDTATIAGSAPVKGGVPVVNGGSFYQSVAASQTATTLQSSTGATGDYLSHCDVYPTSTSPGVVTVFDNTNTAANSTILFPGGATSLSNLAPFAIPVGAVSVNGAWKVTTGASVSVVCYGKFS